MNNSQLFEQRDIGVTAWQSYVFDTSSGQAIEESDTVEIDTPYVGVYEYLSTERDL